jgi:hypothetical protein
MGSLRNILDILLAPTAGGEEVLHLHRKMVAMEQELLNLESFNGGNGHGNGHGHGERIAHLRASIAENKAKITTMV